jgi:hypothetical protein
MVWRGRKLEQLCTGAALPFFSASTEGLDGQGLNAEQKSMQLTPSKLKGIHTFNGTDTIAKAI